MPRAFSEKERQAIRQRLITAGRDSIVRYGLRGLTVEALARQAGISKGAFYAFFPTKEALVMAVLQTVESEARADLERVLAEPAESAQELVARFLRHQFETLRREPVLAVITDPEEAAVLLRAVPPEELERRRREDDEYYAAIFADWTSRGLLRAGDPTLLARLPRVAFALQLQRGLVGEDRFDEVVQLLVDSLAHALTPR